LASLWFGDKERALSTALGGLSLPIGCIAGFVIAAGLIGENDGHPDPEMKKKFNMLLIVQNSVVTIGTLPLIILARDKPLSPPSLAASRKED
jgi:hypothetical protein